MSISKTNKITSKSMDITTHGVYQHQIKQKSPFTTQFWFDITRLEGLMKKKKTLNFPTLEELVQLYAKIVEYYDGQKDTIKVYFLDKIQNILTGKECLKLIIEERERIKSKKLNKNENLINDKDQIVPKKFRFDPDFIKTKTYKDFMEEIISEENDNDNDNDNEYPLINIKQNLIKKNTTENGNTLLEKSQFLSLYEKIENIKREAEEGLIKLIQDFSILTQQNDNIIKESLDIQSNNLKAKLQTRRILALSKRNNHNNHNHFQHSLTTIIPIITTNNSIEQKPRLLSSESQENYLSQSNERDLADLTFDINKELNNVNTTTITIATTTTTTSNNNNTVPTKKKGSRVKKKGDNNASKMNKNDKNDGANADQINNKKIKQSVDIFTAPNLNIDTLDKDKKDIPNNIEASLNVE